MNGPFPDTPADGAEPFLPPDWPELAPLLDAVLDAAPEHRAALILELSAGDPARRRSLEDLVTECERDAPLLNHVAAERFDDLTNEDADRLLPEFLGDRYRVGRELGRGGMARVYLARDLKHGRDVAIKVIRPEMSAALGHDRFLREIEIAARLNHPNIVPLHDSGEVAGSLYFVMPYEEGPSLRERLARDGALPVSDALNVLRDVARALAYAHEHGVVHRDVKPDNVMFSGGTAVVTDFGIAKAVSAALTDVAAPMLTQAGSGIGTPAYMAPEQATGDPSTDHRADIYSFGCLAYELFTGNPPFQNQSVHEVIAAHISTVPRVVTTLRADVPPAVAKLIERCLEKSPAARPQTARELLESLEGAATGTTAVKRRPARALRWVGLALVVGMIGTGAYLASRASSPSGPIRMVVLPFGNIDADSTVEYVANWLADDVAKALLNVRGIQIVSRSGARSYSGNLTVDVTEAGARLSAAYVMTGVMRQERGSWILSLDLARAADAATVWGEDFNVGPQMQGGAADIIARNLTTGLRSRFGDWIGSPQVPRANQRTSNNQAYLLSLRGQDKLDRRSQNVRESAEWFRAAIRQDSLYAQAWSGLSMALALYPHHEGSHSKVVHDELVNSARRALKLDPTLAQPHVALGMAHGFAYHWDSAAAEFKTAVALDGHHIEARTQYARHLRNRGRLDEAFSQLRAAREEDSASAVVLSHMSYLYYLDRQMDSALKESERALQNDPTNRTTLVMGALINLGLKNPKEARRLIDLAPKTSPLITYVIAKSGDTATARQRLHEEDAERPQPGFAETRRAHTYLGLGDTAQALSALKRATDAKEIWAVVESYLDPIYDPIRGSARYRELLRRVGLPR